MNFTSVDSQIQNVLATGNKGQKTVQKYNFQVERYATWCRTNCNQTLSMITEESPFNIMRYITVVKTKFLENRHGTDREGANGFPTLEMIRSALIWYYKNSMNLHEW